MLCFSKGEDTVRLSCVTSKIVVLVPQLNIQFTHKPTCEKPTGFAQEARKWKMRERKAEQAYVSSRDGVEIDNKLNGAAVTGFGNTQFLYACYIYIYIMCYHVLSCAIKYTQ